MLYNGDNSQVLKEIKSDSVQLILTSPPYDNLRDYNSEFDLKTIIKESYRILTDTGVIVWVVGDATIDGSETGTSFKQAIKFMKYFKLHDTMIYEKNSSTYPANQKSNRYTQIFEYMFVFSKGKVNANLIIDKKNKYAGSKDFSGILKNPVPEYSPRTNIWRYTTSFDNDTKHPAVFPLQLAMDHIITWTNTGDTVLDCFMGSGTTGVACKKLKRKFIGIEIDKEYFEIAKQRIKTTQKGLF